jgi:phage gp46-like protein
MSLGYQPPGYQYDGDPRIEIEENGAEIYFVGGQPIMDRGLENAAIISLFTDEDWAGNALLTGPGEAIGSKFEKQATEEAITLTTLDTLAELAKAALAWMITLKVAGAIDAALSNPTGRQIEGTLTITPPGGGSATALALTRNGPNWTAQKTDPAYARLPER